MNKAVILVFFFFFSPRAWLSAPLLGVFGSASLRSSPLILSESARPRPARSLALEINRFSALTAGGGADHSPNEQSRDSWERVAFIAVSRAPSQNREGGGLSSSRGGVIKRAG